MQNFSRSTKIELYTKFTDKYFGSVASIEVVSTISLVDATESQTGANG